jgi:hypothetical protein
LNVPLHVLAFIAEFVELRLLKFDGTEIQVALAAQRTMTAIEQLCEAINVDYSEVAANAYQGNPEWSDEVIVRLARAKHNEEEIAALIPAIVSYVKRISA